jgi:hypothetical protein
VPSTVPTVIIFKDADTNSLATSEIESAPAFSYNEFALAYKNVIQAQPGLSTSSNEFARAVIAALSTIVTKSASDSDVGVVIKAVTKAGLVDTFDQFSKLKGAEKYLVLTNPSKASKSQQASVDAVNATKALFTGSQYLTRADAFRHSYWNWLMSQCCTVQWAASFATAHESNGVDNNDQRMDLNNNLIGRNLFAKMPSASPADAQAALLDYPVLWVNSTKKNVVVGADYLVYLTPMQQVTVADNGPVYDDIFTITLDGKVVGDTPAGSGTSFEFDQIASGTHSLISTCKLDGTKGGCGFSVTFAGASSMANNLKILNGVIQQGGSQTISFTFPTMKTSKTD